MREKHNIITDITAIKKAGVFAELLVLLLGNKFINSDGIYRIFRRKQTNICTYGS